MTDNFRDCFVGEKGYEALKKSMKNGNDFCIDAAKCFQERNEAEAAYVKALRKNSEALSKLAGQTKGTLALAFTTLATQTEKESNAHGVIATTLLSDIAMPLKNLAETQAKERKLIEDTLNGKFKEWNAQKNVDNKYRTRQFEKCREIETLNIKINELSSSTKSSARSKANSVSTPLVMSCVFPGGRHTSASEKSSASSDVKYQTNLEASINKAEEELKKIERKYHSSTKDVELLRQACDIELYRKCEELEKIELNRINEISNYIRTYANTFQTLSDTMYQVTRDLYSIQIIPSNDITVQARSNVQSTEIEILLYDIYATDEKNFMNEQRRILSLMDWIAQLKRDIESQEQIKNEKRTSVSSLVLKSNRVDSPLDDGGDSSSDGAMCSSSSHSKKDYVSNTVHHQDESSSSNDDDGAMHRTKREKKKKEGFSSEVFVDRRGTLLLEELYRGSLYKIECVFNKIKNLYPPSYKYADRLTGLHNEKGFPTTVLRLPSQALPNTPATAPSATESFATAMPTFDAVASRQRPVAYSLQRQAPAPIGFTAVEQRVECSAPGPPYPMHDRMVPSGPTYPVLMAAAAAPPPPPPTTTGQLVRARYPYLAAHKDELSFAADDIILLLESRKDGWCKGNLNGKIGLFPGNFVQNA